MILWRPGGRVTFFWANILILFLTTSIPLHTRTPGVGDQPWTFTSYSFISNSFISNSFIKLIYIKLIYIKLIYIKLIYIKLMQILTTATLLHAWAETVMHEGKR